MFRCFLIVACLAFLAPLAVYAQPAGALDRVIGVVGNKIILYSDVEAQYKLLQARQGKDEQLPEGLYCLILDQLMANALLLSQAERDSVFADEGEVEQQLNSRIQQILMYMGGDEQQFRAYYDMTPNEMKERMREDMADQILVEQMRSRATNSASITPKEVKDFFAAIPKDSLPYFKSEVELGEIVIKPKVSEEEDRRAREKAESLRRRIVEDKEDFEKLAREYSDDPGSRRLGGNLGMMGRGQFVSEFEAAAYQLQKGEVSEVVKTEFGYHIIQLIDRLGNNINTRHILIRPRILFADQEAARERLEEIRNLILSDSITFDMAVQRYSEDNFSKTRNGQILDPMTGEPYIETGELDVDIFFAIEYMQVGDISEPIEFTEPDGEVGYRIVQIRNRTDPHIANLQDDYSRIQKAALESKRSEALLKWMDRILNNHYIELRIDGMPNLSGCASVLDRWIKAAAQRNTRP